MPNLCETIDYAEVQGVLFPRVAVSSPMEVVTCRSSSRLRCTACLYEDAHIVRQSRHVGDVPPHGWDSRPVELDTEAGTAVVPDTDEGTRCYGLSFSLCTTVPV